LRGGIEPIDKYRDARLAAFIDEPAYRGPAVERGNTLIVGDTRAQAHQVGDRFYALLDDLLAFHDVNRDRNLLQNLRTPARADDDRLQRIG
jgi:hypothetical protein